MQLEIESIIVEDFDILISFFVDFEIKNKYLLLRFYEGFLMRFNFLGFNEKI
jgi:hypothetical protein